MAFWPKSRKHINQATWRQKDVKDVTCLVLLQISKSCKRTDSDGFFKKKSADPDADLDSGWKYYKHVFTDVWFGVRTSNGRKWRKTIPLAGNKHCYELMNNFKWPITGRPFWSAAGTRDSVDRLRSPLDTRPLCVRRCMHVISASHITGVALTVR